MKKILIVLACLALVPFAACGLLSMSTCGILGLRASAEPALKEAATKTSQTSARELRRAAEQWRGMHASDQCPTLGILHADKAIDTVSKLTDAWGNPFEITCTDDETTVTSAGPDNTYGTADDIRIPLQPGPAAATPDVAPVEVSRDVSGTVSIAGFTKDTRLDECDDFTITFPRGADAGPETVTKELGGILKTMSKNVSRLTKLCPEQFRTNVVLASCTIRRPYAMGDSGVAGGLDVAARYYDLDGLTNSDTYMKNCLDMKGDWQAIDKGSDEYRDAVQARARREMAALQKTLGKQNDP